MFKWILAALCTLSSLGVCLPKYLSRGRDKLGWKFAGTASALPLAVYGAVVHGGSTWLCAAAITLCAVADVALEKKFLVGMAIFAAAHVCFILWMLSVKPLGAAQLIAWAALLCVVAVLLYSWRKMIGDMMIPYACYAVLLSLMGACAIGVAAKGTLAGILAAVGGLAFVASDALVCKGLIMSVGKSHHWITMGLYYSAQLFFAMAAAVGLK